MFQANVHLLLLILPTNSQSIPPRKHGAISLASLKNTHKRPSILQAVLRCMDDYRSAYETTRSGLSEYLSRQLMRNGTGLPENPCRILLQNAGAASCCLEKFHAALGQCSQTRVVVIEEPVWSCSRAWGLSDIRMLGAGESPNRL